ESRAEVRQRWRRRVVTTDSCSLVALDRPAAAGRLAADLAPDLGLFLLPLHSGGPNADADVPIQAARLTGRSGRDGRRVGHLPNDLVHGISPFADAREARARRGRRQRFSLRRTATVSAGSVRFV